MRQLTKKTWAKFAGVFSGLVFGVFWIPLRALDEAGFPGLWSTTLFHQLSLLLVLPFIVHHWRSLIPGRTRLHLSTMTAGLAYALYSGAFLYTDVIHVIVLFYLMPIWGFLLARIFMGERVTPIRWLSMTLGLSGLLVISGVENGLPVVQNIGDWMALIGGIVWAGASTLILADKEDAVNYTTGFIFWSAVISTILAWIGTQTGVIPLPDWTHLDRLLLWLIPFQIIIIIPAAFATMYSPSQLNPGIVGLLFMTEISVGTTTAALFADEPFGVREAIGIVLITLAGIAEPLYQKLALKNPP